MKQKNIECLGIPREYLSDGEMTQQLKEALSLPLSVSRLSQDLQSGLVASAWAKLINLCQKNGITHTAEYIDKLLPNSGLCEALLKIGAAELRNSATHGARLRITCFSFIGYNNSHNPDNQGVTITARSNTINLKKKPLLLHNKVFSNTLTKRQRASGAPDAAAALEDNKKSDTACQWEEKDLVPVEFCMRELRDALSDVSVSVTPSEKSYIDSANRKICELSKQWVKQNLTSHAWGYSSGMDARDGINYVKEYAEEFRIPVSAFPDVLRAGANSITAAYCLLACESERRKQQAFADTSKPC